MAFKDAEYNAIAQELTKHTETELCNFMVKHEILVPSTKFPSYLAYVITKHLEREYDYEIALSMVQTESSYVLKDGD